MGTAITPELVSATQELYAPNHSRALPPGVTVTRDQPYGADERNRLNVFATEATGPRPVVIYVHGGGFVRGDNVLPGTPYYDNIGLWSACNSFVGVTMRYRLAPANRYPAGAEDVGAAIGWVRDNIGRFGGNSEAIVLVGQSAGAAHAVMYAARPDLYVRGGIGVAGIVLLSGVYDFTTYPPSDGTRAYIGDDVTATAAASAIDGLMASRAPLLFAAAEFDPPEFQAQAMQLADALFARDSHFPNILYLPRHNHISQVVHLNAQHTGDPLLSLRLAEFVQSVTNVTAPAIG